MSKIKIKAHCNYCRDSVLREHLNRCCPNSDYIWKDIEITSGLFYDYFVIFNFPRHPFFDKHKTIVLNSETKTTRDHIKYNAYTFFGFSPDDSYYFVYDTNKYHNVDKWFHTLNYRELMKTDFSLLKNKLISGIISNNKQLLGHQKRLELAHCLDVTEGYEHYGYGDLSSISSYKGVLQKKEDGLIPFKYHFNCENDFEEGYFTEKFLDALFFECLIFYDGCTNLGKFFNPDSFMLIDVNNIEESLAVIKESIANNLWEKKIKAIKQEKIRAVNEYNPMEIIWKIVHGKVS